MTTVIQDEVMRLYAEMDAELGAKLSGVPISCRKGCAGCCHLLVEVSMSEGLMIANLVASWPDTRLWIRRLFAAAREQVGPEVTVASHFNRAVPCVFLTSEKTCRIYPYRPAACRYLLVKSPAENCFPDSKDPVVHSYALPRQAFHHVVLLDRVLVRDNPALGPMAAGLLPHMVLWGLHQSARYEADRRYIEKRIRRLPTPQEWTQRAAESKRTERDSTRKAKL